MPLFPWQDRRLIRCLEVPEDIQNAMMARPHAESAATGRDASRGAHSRGPSRGRSPRRDAGADPWGYADPNQGWNGN